MPKIDRVRLDPQKLVALAVRAELTRGELAARATVTGCTWGRAARGERIHPVVFGGKLYVPPSLHPALSEPARPELVSADSVKGLSEGRRNRAAAKVRALNDFERYGRHGEGRALGRVAALARFVQTHADGYRYRADGAEQVLKVSVRSLERWRRQWHWFRP